MSDRAKGYSLFAERFIVYFVETGGKQLKIGDELLVSAALLHPLTEELVSLTMPAI